MIEAEVEILRTALDSARGIHAVRGAVDWIDFATWRQSLVTRDLVFTLARKPVTLKLGFAWAARSHYFVHAETVEGEPWQAFY